MSETIIQFAQYKTLLFLDAHKRNFIVKKMRGNILKASCQTLRDHEKPQQRKRSRRKFFRMSKTKGKPDVYFNLASRD
jgi:hypothetical protein